MLKHRLIQRLSCKVFHNTEGEVPGQTLDKLLQQKSYHISTGDFLQGLYVFNFRRRNAVVEISTELFGKRFPLFDVLQLPMVL